MRILFLSDHFFPEPSAPAAHVYERARLWVRQGHQVTVLCSAPNFPEGKLFPGYRNALRTVETLDGIRVVRVLTYMSANEGTFRRTLDYLSYACSALLMAWREARPDVVISTSPHLFVPLAGVLHARLRGVPHVFEIRDLWPASIAATEALARMSLPLRLLEKLELSLYRSSARILALTPAFKIDLVRRGIPADKIDVVINGANLELFRPGMPRDTAIERQYGLAGRFVVGYLGTLGLAHGLENVLDAAERLRGTSVTFLFVGVGAAKADLEVQVRRRALDNVRFAPRQEKAAMPAFWSVCDASLVHLRAAPLFGTVIPSKIFEAMAVGVPTIYAAPRGEGSHIVELHDAGIVVAPMDPGALAAACLTLAQDPQLRARLAAAASQAAPLYSRTRQAEDSLAVLRRACSARLPS
ncbi:MAG TPA: glycosyltransferase family 4 protein [Steroidobacteraceae bacterium]|jgi:glycosyltransferase involved in cell wall biosynthesis